MADSVPGAYCTTGGVPHGCIQIPVYNYWDRLHPEPDHVEAFFLVDSQFAPTLVNQPAFGKWRLLRSGRCQYATWRNRPLPDGTIVRHKLQNEVWTPKNRD